MAGSSHCCLTIDKPNPSRRTVVFAALLLITFCAYADTFTGQAVSVLEGDTIEVLHKGKTERVRLHGIDCPEENQAFGSRAKVFTSSLVLGKHVLVRAFGKDRYDRTIGEVLLPNGKSLNHELVKAGLAWWHRQDAPDDPLLEGYESTARRRKLGLWSDSQAMPPWEFRENEKESNRLPAPPPTPQTQPDRSTQHGVSVSASDTSTPETTARPSDREPTPSASLDAAQANKTIPPLPLKLPADMTGAREETAFEKRAKQKYITQLEQQATPTFLESLGPDWRELRLHQLRSLVRNLPELERKLQEGRERRLFLIGWIKENASQEYLESLGVDWEENLPLSDLSEHAEELLAQKGNNEPDTKEESESRFPPRIERPLTQAERVRRYNAEMARIRAIDEQKAARAQAIAQANQAVAEATAEAMRRQNLISSGLIEQGFTYNEVRSALGNPENWSRHNLPEYGMVTEYWHYPKGLVRFENGLVTSWSVDSY